MEWDIMWMKAHPEREWGNCSPTQKEEKFNQLPVPSRLIFLADHLASHHNEDSDLPFDDFEVLVFEDFCSPQFWGVMMRGETLQFISEKTFLVWVLRWGGWNMCITRYKNNRNRQLEWHKIHWEPVKESLGLDIPTRYRTINLIRSRNLPYGQRKNGIQGLQQSWLPWRRKGG